MVNVDLRTPATDLLIRRRNDEYAPSCQADLTGEVWRFVVPADEDRTRGVILQGTYGGDDAIFGIRLKLHPHPVDSKALGDLNPCLPSSQ